MAIPSLSRRLPDVARAMLIMVVLMLGSCVAATTPLVSTSGGTPQPLPHLDHIVVVIEENHSYGDIIGSADAPFINALARQGALFTDAHGVTHPSQPNYLALFAGSTLGVTSDTCPQSFSAPNLASVLLAHGQSFAGYSESMPSAGFTGCDDGNFFNSLYARKHNPWVDFTNVPSSVNQTMQAFPADFTQLPTVAFVVPNLQDDMHDGSVHAGDAWLQSRIGLYATWSATHNSLLVVTWDEDDGSAANQIPTLIVGTHVHAGRYGETITHYDVLRTIEALEGIPFTGNAAQGMTIADIWQA